ncbi:MAG: hypothetical protein ACQESB_02030, partial [Elusimicrobiota bacterium]
SRDSIRLLGDISPIDKEVFKESAEYLIDFFGNDIAEKAFINNPEEFKSAALSLEKLGREEFESAVENISDILSMEALNSAFVTRPHVTLLSINELIDMGFENFAAITDILGKEAVSSLFSNNVFEFKNQLQSINFVSPEDFAKSTEMLVNIFGESAVRASYLQNTRDFTLLARGIDPFDIDVLKILSENIDKEDLSQVLINEALGLRASLREISALGIDDYLTLESLIGEESISEAFISNPLAFSHKVKSVSLLGMDKFEKFISLAGRKNIADAFSKSPDFFTYIIERAYNADDFENAIEKITEKYFSDFEDSGLYTALIWQEFYVRAEEKDVELTDTEWRAVYSCLKNIEPMHIKGLNTISFGKNPTTNIRGAYYTPQNIIQLNLAYMSEDQNNMRLFSQVLFHELTHHIDFSQYGGEAFNDLHARSEFHEDFAREYGRTSHQEDFTTVAEQYGVNSRAQFIRAISQAKEGKPVYLEKVLFVSEVFTKSCSDCTILYHTDEMGLVHTSEVAVEKNAEGKIKSIEGISIKDLEGLHDYFTR